MQLRIVYLIIFCFIQLSAQSQDYSQKRKLEVLDIKTPIHEFEFNEELSQFLFEKELGNKPGLEFRDSMIYRHKLNKNGEIKHLIQYIDVYHDEAKGEFTMIKESYKRGKYWEVLRMESQLQKQKKNSTYYIWLRHGKQFYFDEEGKIIAVYAYDMGNIVFPTIEIYYYPSGELKFITETKVNGDWNITSYKYPNGDDYSFGDFVDGQGKIIHLNNEGEPCLECSYDERYKLKERYLCD